MEVRQSVNMSILNSSTHIGPQAQGGGVLQKLINPMERIKPSDEQIDIPT